MLPTIIRLLFFLALLVATTAQSNEWSEEISCYTVHERFGMQQEFLLERFPFPLHQETGVRTLEQAFTLQNRETVHLAAVFREANDARDFPELLLVLSYRSSDAKPRVLDQEVVRSTDLTAYSQQYIDVLLDSWNTVVAASYKLDNIDVLSKALAAGYPYNLDRAYYAGHIADGETKSVHVGCTLGRD